VAKDTEKLIRQLSLISFLMAQGRPVSALEIKREVEGYSDMNEDAFARRFYADRAELESLGIQLGVEKPGEGFFEAELYSLPPENFYLDAIKFTDDELAALSTALLLLSDGEFAYAEPLRLALQQVAWGHPNPLKEGERAPVEMAMTASAGGRELSQRLSKIETAISRRKTIEFTYYTMERDETAKRKVDPYHLVFRGGQFYLIGYAHEREAVRVFRLSRIQGKVGYGSKAEHDFSPPEDFDRRDYGQRADWQLGEIRGTAKIFVRDRIAWLIERDFGPYGTLRPAKKSDGAPGKGCVFETDYASPRELIAWVLRWRQNAQVLAPDELRSDAEGRLGLLQERHQNGFEPAKTVDRCARCRAGRAQTAAARRRSAPSASPVWSPSPAY
jgi:proteasome accessory factor C